jgi:cytochrome c oxidase assembly protein subunit 15
VGLIVFQALLGMWTVTLLLKPLIVVGHLFGGLGTLALLSSLARWRETRFPAPTPALRALGIAALAALVLQIFLGGWTSSNYAAVACPDFPKCQTRWWPPVTDFKDAFVLWRGLGQNYEGGVLDSPARTAIHFTHRLGALLAAVLIGLFGARLWLERVTKGDGLAVLVALVSQLTLGVSIVVFHVPLYVAVAHNGVAALLLLTVINGNQRLSKR